MGIPFLFFLDGDGGGDGGDVGDDVGYDDGDDVGDDDNVSENDDDDGDDDDVGENDDDGGDDCGNVLAEIRCRCYFPIIFSSQPLLSRKNLQFLNYLLSTRHFNCFALSRSFANSVVRNPVNKPFH